MTSQPKWAKRLGIIVFAIVVGLVVRILALSVFNVDFVSSGGELGHDHLDVGVRPVIVVVGISGLLGWLAAWILDRAAGARAQMIWTVGAVVVWIAATVPLIPWPMPGKVRFTLMLMHTLVAVAYIIPMRKTVGAAETD